MAYDRLTKRLAAGEIIVLDGATGTELQRRGAAMDPAAWCAPATLHADRLLTEIHADYIDAGADVITANTFASSRLMLSGAGLAERTDEINRRAVAAALRARDTHERSAQVVVAGSLSHMMPMAAGTATLDPRTVPSDSQIRDAFNEQELPLLSNRRLARKNGVHPARVCNSDARRRVQCSYGYYRERRARPSPDPDAQATRPRALPLVVHAETRQENALGDGLPVS
jgi:Homocysteine S-methyltransferase